MKNNILFLVVFLFATTPSFGQKLFPGEQCMVIKEDKSLWAWGIDYAENAPIRTSPIKILDNIKKIITDDRNYLLGHTLAIKSDDTLWGWGYNYHGQIGDGGSGNMSNPNMITDDVLDAVVGSFCSFIIKKDNSLWACGDNDYGQLGTGTTEDIKTPTKIMDDVLKVVNYSNSTFVIKTDNSLWGFGRNDSYRLLGDGTTQNRLTPVMIMDNVKDVCCDYNGTFYIKTDDSLWGCSEDTRYLGTGTHTTSYKPVKITDNILQFCSSGVVLKKDNSLWTWGEYEGWHGNEFTYSKPHKILDDVLQVSNYNSAFFAITKDNSLWAWGSNYYGQLGDGTCENKDSPVKIMDNVSKVLTGGAFAVAIKKDNSLWFWGNSLFVDSDNGMVLKPKQIAKNIDDIEVSYDNVIYTTDDGTVWVFGDSSYGQLGYNGGIQETPQRVDLNNVIQISATNCSSYAIDLKGGLYGWGLNEFNLLSDIVVTKPELLDNNVIQVCAGNDNIAVVKNDKSLWKWDSNGFTYILSNVEEVTLGSRHALAIRTDGTLWSWGYNEYGQIGNGIYETSTYYSSYYSPSEIMNDVVRIAAGMYHSLAIRKDGSLWAWGDNSKCQLGDGTTEMRSTPIKIMDNVVEVSAGQYWSCAVKEDGSLWVWGSYDNYYSSYSSDIIPRQIATNISKACVGKEAIYAINKYGGVYRYGRYSYDVHKICDDVEQICSGGGHVLVVKKDGSLCSFGSNHYGQLGIGTKGYSETPIMIMNINSYGDEREYSQDGVLYLLNSDYSARIKAINVEGKELIIPDKLNTGSGIYIVNAIGDDVFAGNVNVNTILSVHFPSSISDVSENSFSQNGPLSVIWNSNTKLPESSFSSSSYKSGNFLLYVNSSDIAPSGITNLVVNGTAESITLKDGYSFYCPQQFTAKKISYTHNYRMETGIDECAGWESIALPFDVQTVTHESKGDIIPFANYTSGSGKHPFWLLGLGNSGFSKASSIKANTPYLISMPNNSKYSAEYNLSGKVTFSSTDAIVMPTSSKNLKSTTYNGAVFAPNYTVMNRDINSYSLNVTNDFFTNSGNEKPGSVFLSFSREIYPFEGYLSKVSSGSRSIEIPFADSNNTTGIEDLLLEKEINPNRIVEIFNLSGQCLKKTVQHEVDKVMEQMPAGIYIVNGKKRVINK